jgi:hypothetical protein
MAVAAIMASGSLSLVVLRNAAVLSLMGFSNSITSESAMKLLIIAMSLSEAAFQHNYSISVIAEITG